MNEFINANELKDRLIWEVYYNAVEDSQKYSNIQNAIEHTVDKIINIINAMQKPNKYVYDKDDKCYYRKDD